MRNLIHLNLSRNDIGDKGVLFLAEASYMSNLEVLLLDDNNLTSAGA
jgi:Ran GTPase-activating protein (RanGAP) involved in mRNA processing and transport